MAVNTFAAIVLGSEELSMKIYELSKQKGITELAHLRHKLSIDVEIFKNGFISYNTMADVCDVLIDFNQIMKEFAVTNHKAYACDALREANNKLVLIDHIKVRAGIKFELISNSEERFLFYKALHLREPNINSILSQNTLVVDPGSGTVQLTPIINAKMKLTQNLKLGPSRINELLSTIDADTFSLKDLISEYIDKDLREFCNVYLGYADIKHILAVGSVIPSIKYHLLEENKDFDGFISAKELAKKDFKIPRSYLNSSSLISTILLFKKIVNLTNARDIYLSSVDLCDGIVEEYAEKRIKLTFSHDFSSDILSTAKHIAVRYQSDMAHIENVSYLALEIFDHIKKIHGLGKREKLLLHLASILHSCGAYVNMEQTRENSYKIIESNEIIGISHRERIMVANIVRYNDDKFPSYKYMKDEVEIDDYITIVKLCAILRLANVMDKSNMQKIKKIDIKTKGRDMEIIARTVQDITLERGLFTRKAEIFEEVFGIKPVLIKK